MSLTPFVRLNRWRRQRFKAGRTHGKAHYYDNDDDDCSKNNGYTLQQSEFCVRACVSVCVCKRAYYTSVVQNDVLLLCCARSPTVSLTFEFPFPLSLPFSLPLALSLLLRVLCDCEAQAVFVVGQRGPSFSLPSLKAQQLILSLSPFTVAGVNT